MAIVCVKIKCGLITTAAIVGFSCVRGRFVVGRLAAMIIATITSAMTKKIAGEMSCVENRSVIG